MQYFYYESYTSWIYHDKPSMMFLVGINIRQDNIFICSLIPGYINVFQIIQIIPWYTKCSLWLYKTRKDNIFIRSRTPAGTMHAYIKIVQIVQNYNTLIALYIYNKLLIINRRKNVFLSIVHRNKPILRPIGLLDWWQYRAGMWLNQFLRVPL